MLWPARAPQDRRAVESAHIVSRSRDDKYAISITKSTEIALVRGRDYFQDRVQTPAKVIVYDLRRCDYDSAFPWSALRLDRYQVSDRQIEP